MSFTKKIVFQQDILEWIPAQRKPIQVLRKERYKLEKGFVAYFKDFRDMIRRTDSKIDELAEKSETPPSDKASKAMEQYYESEELIKKMKWKRVTWDDDADYTSFSKRILDNDHMFKRASPFSFMSIHVMKDPSTSDLVNFPTAEKVVEAGSLTNWVLQERDPKPVEPYPTTVTSERKSAFTVDWSSGEVKILDTASAREILIFLSTVAHRLQSVQVRMEEQQTRQTENVENVRVRVGAVVKFNEFDTSFWDDPKRKMDRNYVDPDEVEMFLKGMLKSPLLYRWFLKGQQFRIVPSGRPYYVDMEKNELQIPANFIEYNWLTAHPRFEKAETFVNSFRRFWWFWFAFGMVLIGDVEIF